jgi:Tol biopolymer transport system component
MTGIYLSDNLGQLFEGNKPTKLEKVADLDEVMTDLAMADNGDLYGISFNNLYKIDPQTGTTEYISSPGISEANGFEISDSGVAYVTSASKRGIYELDLEDGTTTRVYKKVSEFSAGDIVEIGNKLYFSTTSEELIILNLNSGNVKSIVHGINNLNGLAEKNGKLFGFAGDEVYKFNKKQNEFGKGKELDDVAKAWGATDTGDLLFT